jgi:hypothetical protein
MVAEPYLDEVDTLGRDVLVQKGRDVLVQEGRDALVQEGRDVLVQEGSKVADVVVDRLDSWDEMR